MTQRRIYQCAFPYLITFNVLDDEWIFDDRMKAELLYGLILNVSELKNHIVYQFCIMPNHVHILCQTVPHRGFSVPHRGFSVPHRGFSVPHRGLENPLCRNDDPTQIPRSLQSGLSSPRCNNTLCNCGKIHKYTISDFIKSIRGTFSHKLNKGQIWHPRFYDRIIEIDEGIERAINYIRYNPDEWNLPKKWKKYPYQYYCKTKINKLFS